MHTLKTLPLLLLFPLAAGTSFHNTGVRELVCRGKPGIDLRITSKPSPDDPKMVRMTLRYTPAPSPIGAEYQNLAPGNCSWNPGSYKTVPPETGVVYFDILPEAQPWFANYRRQMDTTVDAAAFYTDTISLPRYLARTDRYWKFFVDDQTNMSISNGAYNNAKRLPTLVYIDAPFGKTPAVAELRCRGGGSGLFFKREETRPNNQTIMWMSYRLSGLEAGEDARGLTEGTCAWVKRNGLDREPGRIDFVTASNAQLAQARTGGTVDKSPTAAERYPDANTIPLYMQDPSHYWSFHVTMDQPKSARAHEAWRRGFTGGARTAATPTDRQGPTPGARERPGTSAVARVIDPPLIFHEVVRKPDQYWLRFSARANSKPEVLYSTEPPKRYGTLLGFPKPLRMAVRQLEEKNYAAEFSTAPVRGLPMNTKYYFVINVPAGPEQQKREYSGEFTTTASYVTVRFTRIDVLNDSDTDSDGDLAFRFNITPPPYTTVRCGTGDDCRYFLGHVSWGSGSHNPVDITLNMVTGANAIRIWVAGADDDGGPGYVQRVNDEGYGSKGYSTQMADRNTASGEFRINYFPERSGMRTPFKIRSVDGSVLMFEVIGEIEVTRR